MRFRTEIDIRPSSWKISHDGAVVLLGSCFSDEIGSRLETDGFSVLRNPFGPLYNPVSLSACIRRALCGPGYSAADLVEGPAGYHCLDFASRYCGSSADTLLATVNTTSAMLGDTLRQASAVIITLGTAYVFDHRGLGRTVGNCHKFPATDFERRLLSVSDAADALDDALNALKDAGAAHVILTVSPIRHLADGLHGNTVSKSTLMLAVEDVIARHGDFAAYFPSYEMLIDDLRDYRFYAADMKHPSPTAADYIYEIFSQTYFTRDTCSTAAEHRRRYLASQHRRIL